ncbi:MAG: FAD-binding protein [Chloroflexota bacterium]
MASFRCQGQHHMTENQNETARQNWATNIQFQAQHFMMPETIEQLQETVRAAAKVKVVGAGHSFNDIADTTGTLVSLNGLEKFIEIDREQQTAVFHAGMTYIDIAPLIDKAGFALPNLSSTPHVTVIGACMTATHGSGDGNKILSDQVSALEIVNAEGELIQLSRATHGEKFNGMVVSLGGLGVVTKVTLDLVPSYQMQHEFYRQLPLANMVAHFDKIMGSAYSISLGTRWQNEIVDLALIRRRLVDAQAIAAAPTFYGGMLIGDELFANYPIERITFQQSGVAGAWYERLPFFNICSTLSGENERQSEYFVRREQAVEALTAVSTLSDQMAPFLKITEIRTIAADDHWLSPAYKQDCVGIHFSWIAAPEAISNFLPVLEKALAPYQPRPHWGKMFTMPPAEVQACYEKTADFKALLAEFDPQGKFRNDYLTRYMS